MPAAAENLTRSLEVNAQIRENPTLRTPNPIREPGQLRSAPTWRCQDDLSERAQKQLQAIAAFEAGAGSWVVVC